MDDLTAKRLADVILVQAEATRQNTRALDSIRLQLQGHSNIASELNHKIELFIARTDMNVGDIKTKQAVIADNVKDVQREISSSHALPPARAGKDTGKHAAVGMLRAFGEMPRAAQILLVVAVSLFAASGWLLRLVEWLAK